MLHFVFRLNKVFSEGNCCSISQQFTSMLLYDTFKLELYPRLPDLNVYVPGQQALTYIGFLSNSELIIKYVFQSIKPSCSMYPVILRHDSSISLLVTPLDTQQDFHLLFLILVQSVALVVSQRVAPDWNSLPASLCKTLTLSSFRQSLKKLLFGLAYRLRLLPG